MVTILSIVFVLVSLLLIFMVVITPSQEGGLASAFGGMGADSFFGTKAHRQISRFTVFLAVSFLALAILLSLLAKPPDKKDDKGGAFPETPKEEPAPAPEPGPEGN
ncbi:MAG: preprotein translocase subunit SecG [Planctomycetota bacterium]|jgi:protein translocase SecG subunit